MPATKTASLYDFVELTKPVEGAKAGERGTVLDFLERSMAIVELRTPLAELDLDRIVVAPLDALRVVKHASSSKRAA